MKRVLGIVGLILAFATSAGAQALPPNYMNMLFYISGCATYVSQTSFPPAGAVCIDTTSGGMYVSNGTAFVIGGSEIWTSNAGAGQTTATTTFFTASGNSTNNTTEAATMELATGGSNPTVVRSLTCYDSAAPTSTNTDTFTVRSATSLGGTMGASTITCQITGSAKTCSDTTHTLALAAGSVIDISDATTGTPSARTIGCVVQVDEL